MYIMYLGKSADREIIESGCRAVGTSFSVFRILSGYKMWSGVERKQPLEMHNYILLNFTSWRDL